jgi:hypothetical protein
MGVSALLFPPKRDSKTLFIVLTFFEFEKFVLNDRFPCWMFQLFCCHYHTISFLKTKEEGGVPLI